jgi:hypothetical protein
MAIEVMSEKIESENKALVLEAFDTPLNKRVFVAPERFRLPNYTWEATTSVV